MTVGQTLSTWPKYSNLLRAAKQIRFYYLCQGGYRFWLDFTFYYHD